MVKPLLGANLVKDKFGMELRRYRALKTNIRHERV